MGFGSIIRAIPYTLLAFAIGTIVSIVFGHEQATAEFGYRVPHWWWGAATASLVAILIGRDIWRYWGRTDWY